MFQLHELVLVGGEYNLDLSSIVIELLFVWTVQAIDIFLKQIDYYNVNDDVRERLVVLDCKVKGDDSNSGAYHCHFA